MHNIILEAREKRAKEIESWLMRGCDVLVQIHANIPNAYKNQKEAYIVVRFFEMKVKSLYQINHIERFDSADGPYTLISILDQNPRDVKQMMIDLEDHLRLGRLVDIDVWSIPDQLWSRASLKIPPRKCYLCDDIAHHCIRSQKHSLSDIMLFIKDTTLDHLLDDVSQLAEKVMLQELNLEDKFGLVTPSSTGSHDDMDYHLMKKTQKVIIPHLVNMFKLGYQCEEIYNLFPKARKIGQLAEQEMLEFTEGVNCYKGLIFILGLVMASTGYTLSHIQDVSHIFTNIHHMTQNILDDFEKKPKTFGEKAYYEHQIMGARGEAYLGLPSVHHALNLMKDVPLSDTLLRQVLQQLIRTTDDTVLLKRAGSFEKYLKIKKQVAEIDVTQIEQVRTFTHWAIKENLSFGGSADLLIATLFIHDFAERYF